MPTPRCRRSCASVSRVRSASNCASVCSQGPVKVWMQTHVENGWRPVQITIARLPAPASSPEHDDFSTLSVDIRTAGSRSGNRTTCCRQCLQDGISAGVFQILRQDALRPDLRFLERARNRYHVGLDVVCGSELGSSAQELRRLSSNRSTGMHRHHGMVDLFETGTQVFPQRHRGMASEQENPLGATSQTGDSSFFGIGIPSFQGRGAFTEAESKSTAHATLGWWHHSRSRTVWTSSTGISCRSTCGVYTAYLWELTSGAGVAVPICPGLETNLRPAGRTAPRRQKHRPGNSARRCHAFR